MSEQAPSFASLAGVNQRTAQALSDAGMQSAFPIQSAVIPSAIRGRDMLVQSPTGSGKTLAFGVPIIELLANGTDRPTALVLVPTRELAVQVCSDLEPIARAKRLHCAAVYGGASYVTQAKQVKRAAIIVATPGRLEDLIRSRKIDVRNVSILVLDEADRMLDMGFQPQVDKIVESMPRKRQTLLFSATLEGAVARIAREYTENPETVKNAVAPGAGGEIEHVMVASTSSTKVDTVLNLLDVERDLALIFVRTQRGADRLNERLREYGLRSTAIHGGMTQGARLKEYRVFQRGACDVLVATDVFARGMDLDRITHVINYDIPEDADTYQHRTGRTGRAGRAGTALTMVMPSQRKTMQRMCREAGLDGDLTRNMARAATKKFHTVPEEQQYAGTPDKAPARERTPGGSKWQRDKPQRGGAPTPNRQARPGRNARIKARENAITIEHYGAPESARPTHRTNSHSNAHASVRPAKRSNERDASGNCEGVVLSFNPDKGFGFISPKTGGADVFFHHSKVRGAGEAGPEKGARVAFGVERHQRGLRAADVRILAGSGRPRG